MNNNVPIYRRWYIIVPLVFLAGFLIWKFSSIIIYILAAVVLSLMGHPLVKLFDKIKIGRFSFPHTLSALLTLFVIIGIIAAFFAFFVPMLVNQAALISSVNVQSVIDSLKEPMQSLDDFLLKYGLIQENQSIETILTEKLKSIATYINFSDILNYVVTYVGNIFVAVFAIGFFAFFFLKDEHLFYNGVMLITPVKRHKQMTHILSSCKRLLTRYFIGLFLDVCLVISLFSIGMSIIGLKNTFIIGFSAGIMNIVPYIGPFIGGTIGILIAITGNLNLDFYTQMLPVILKMIGVFVTVNLLDGLVFQPTIYSTSVKSHPLEIFTVIMMAGTLAGIPGMIIAIPSYTVLRIVAKEFLSSLRVVKKLTKNI